MSLNYVFIDEHIVADHYITYSVIFPNVNLLMSPLMCNYNYDEF